MYRKTPDSFNWFNYWIRSPKWPDNGTVFCHASDMTQYILLSDRGINKKTIPNKVTGELDLGKSVQILWIGLYKTCNHIQNQMCDMSLNQQTLPTTKTKYPLSLMSQCTRYKNIKTNQDQWTYLRTTITLHQSTFSWLDRLPKWSWKPLIACVE